MALEQSLQQASIQQFPAESLRARVWEMHLQGVPKRRIAEMVDLNRETVARIIQRCYREIAPERKVSPARMLDMAVARMRHVEAQAWVDHDTDDGGHRSQLLRLVLDVEKEIARLEGLYEVGALDAGEGDVTVTFVKLDEGPGGDAKLLDSVRTPNKTGATSADS
jgi:hypothetical protein